MAMGNVDLKSMAPGAFDRWEAEQNERAELVDGEVFAMAGGTYGHDRARANLSAAMLAHLRGTPGRVVGPDVKLRAERDGYQKLATEGLQLLDEALAQIRTPGWEERGYLAEIHRVRAALLAALRREADAEAEFEASLNVAREQKARSLELRAAMDYARFMRGRARSVEALGLLRPAYAWFTEGFDTRDLIEAKVLLDELGN